MSIPTAPAMTRYKKTASRLKDPSHFQGYKVEEKYKEIIEPRKILEEKGFQFPPQPSGIIQTVHIVATRRGWLEFCHHPRDPVVLLVKELYTNLLGKDQRTIWVINTLVPLDPRVINAFYNLPSDIDCEYSKMVESMTPKKRNSVLKTFTVEGSPWASEEGRVINRIDLKPVAKIWVKFMKSRLMSKTHTTTVSQERLILLCHH